MGRRVKNAKLEKAPTLEDLIAVRDDIALALEAKKDDFETEESYALATLGLRVGYVISASIVSIAESLRVLADESEQALAAAHDKDRDERFETMS